MWSTTSLWQGDNYHCGFHILFFVDDNMWSLETCMGTRKNYLIRRYKFCISVAPLTKKDEMREQGMDTELWQETEKTT